VCQKGIYDNMKTAVKTVLQGKEREWNPRFKELCSHHLFEPIACTPASGWEKGQVENQVGTGRNNFFTPLIKVGSLDQLNNDLEALCIRWAKKTDHPEQKEKKVFDVYQEECTWLLPYRSPFDGYKVEHEVVSPYCFIRHATNCYSVECSYVGQPVEIRIYAHELLIMHRGTLIGRHHRSFLRYQRIYDPWHYVPILERKPGALSNGAPFKQLALPESLTKIREHLVSYSDGEKRFVRILLKVISHGLPAVEEACALALTAGGANDTFVLHHLEPPVKEVTQDRLPLAYPPTDHCDHYNRRLLTQQSLLEVSHG